MDDSIVFGWFFDYACTKMLDEFEQSRTVDKKSERKLMSGLLQYTMDDVAERVVRVDFLQLLCVLADGDNPDLKFEKSQTNPSSSDCEEEQLTPLQHALELLDKMQGRGTLEHLREQLDEARYLIKIQAVMTLLRRDRGDDAMAVYEKLWNGDSETETEEERDVMLMLIDIAERGVNRKTREFMKAHSLEHFYTKLMPTLRAINNTFQEPFLLTVLKRKEDMRKQMNGDVTIPCSVLKKACGPTLWKQAMAVTQQMAKQAKGSGSSDMSGHGTSSASTSDSKGRKRTSSSSSASDVISPVKRGKSIRAVHYGRGKTAPTSGAGGQGEAVNWDLSDEEEEGQESRTDSGRGARTGSSPSKRRKTTTSEEVSSSNTSRKPWTEEEEEELRRGIRRYGVGKWAEIKLAFNLDRRSNVQLKDKYRNLHKHGLI